MVIFRASARHGQGLVALVRGQGLAALVPELAASRSTTVYWIVEKMDGAANVAEKLDPASASQTRSRRLLVALPSSSSLSKATVALAWAIYL
jgi:hypothetical protein